METLDMQQLPPVVRSPRVWYHVIGMDIDQ